MRARYKVVGNHIVDTWGGGVIVDELDNGRMAKAARPRRRLSKRARAQVMENFVIAAVFVFGVCSAVALGVRLSYIVMP